MAASSSWLYSSPSLRNSTPTPHTTSFSCNSSSSSLQHGSSSSTGKAFMDFPYVSTSHRQVMVDLVSTLESRLASVLNPCRLPSDVQSYQNDAGTAHAAFHLRSGLQSSTIDFMLGSWLHRELPTGGALNITSIATYLNSSTDAPHFLVELIQMSPTSMILILDMPPRKDTAVNPDYVKTFYEDTRLDRHRLHFMNLEGVTPYVSSSLYTRLFFSPTAVLACVEKGQLEEMVKDHVGPVAKELLETWLGCGPFEERVVGESEREYLKKRDRMSRKKTIEIDLRLKLPQLFGSETADRVMEALQEVF